MTTFASGAELRDAVRQQDPLTVSHLETRTTDVDAWLRNLALDEADGAIIDPVVYLSVVSHIACINDVLDKRVIGGDRESEQYRRRNVEASYTRYDTIQKLSMYCGVICILPDAAGNALAATKETAAKITAATTKIQTGFSKLRRLKPRSGLSLHLHNVDETWSAGPEDAIEVPPAFPCVVCGCDLHFSNHKWRDDAGKYQVLVSAPGEIARGISKTRLDHYHAPEGVVLDEDGNEVGV